VGRRRGAFGAEVVEEPAQRVLVAVLAGPHQPAGVVAGHHEQVALSLRYEISSIPIRRSPASRSVAPARAATTRVTMSDTLRHATRNKIATTESVAWQTSRAVVSSKAVVNRDPGRAQGTAATTTPCSAHDTQRVLAYRNTCVVPRSRTRQRRGVALVS